MREIGGWRGEGICSWNLELSYADSDPVRAADLKRVVVDYQQEPAHAGAEADAAHGEEIRAMRTADGRGWRIGALKRKEKVDDFAIRESDHGTGTL